MSHPNRSKIRDWPAYLLAFRASHNLTQAKLADALMISKRNVENWEAGLREPPAFLKLALEQIDYSSGLH